MPLYLVSKDVFEIFNLNLSDNIYLFRGKDRQLLPYKGDFVKESQTPIKRVPDNYKTKEYFCGYILGHDVNQSDIEIRNLISLSRVYGNVLDVVVFTVEEAKELIVTGRLSLFSAPFLFVFRSGAIEAGRWVLKGEDSLNYDQASDFLERVLNGTENFTVVSSEVPEQGPDVCLREVNALTITDAVLTDLQVTLLLITAHWCPHCREFRPIVDATAKALRQADVAFYWINAPTNDLPSFIPDASAYPRLFLWPAGEDYKRAVQYTGNRTVPDLMEFIKEKGGIDPAAIKQEEAESEPVAEASGGQ
jgi:thiol-disulfide isomerase/thioredoxin